MLCENFVSTSLSLYVSQVADSDFISKSDGRVFVALLGTGFCSVKADHGLTMIII